MKSFIRKSWYTLTEAAEYLSYSTEGAPVTVSDILQLATEGRLFLSIHSFGCIRGEIGTIKWLEDTLPENHPVHQSDSTLIYPASKSSKRAESPSLMEELDYGYHFLKQSDASVTVFPGEYLELTTHSFGESLERLLWELSLNHSPQKIRNFTQLIKSHDPDLFRPEPVGKIPFGFQLPPETLFFTFASDDDEVPSVLKVLLRDLPDDTLLGITRDELDGLLSPHEDDETKGTDEPSELLPEDFQALYKILGNGELPDLDLLITAWRAFWKGRRLNDGKKYPINAEVTEWIKNRMDKPERGNQKAKVIASLIRPSWAPTGRQPSRNL